MQHRDLFSLFLQTGTFTIGGGLAAIPILEEAVVPATMSDDRFLSMIAIAQSSPGSIGANMASYIGVSEAGITGAMISVLGLVLPSLIVITLIARFLPAFSSYDSVKSMFKSIRPAVTGLILSVALSLTVAVLLGRSGPLEVAPFVIFALILFLHFRYKVQSIALIAVGAVCGICLL